MKPSLRILVVGAGSIGERHVRCFLRTKACQVGFCEINEDRRRQVVSNYDVAGSYPDLEAALRDPWDAAVIATPAHTHIPIAVQLARCGLHLLIEKPLSTDEAGLDELARLMAVSGLQVAVAYVLRAHPALADMGRAVHTGRFGAPLEVICTAGQHLPHYRPAYRDIYFANRRTGGGAIQDSLTHVFNACEWLVGPIDRLAVDAAHLRLEGVTVEDTVHVMARHGSVLASYAFNQHQAPSEYLITVVCTGGTVRFDLINNRWQWVIEHGGPWNIEPCDIHERDAMFLKQAERFLRQLEQHTEPLCSLDDGRRTLRANLAALRSFDAQGQWQTVT